MTTNSTTSKSFQKRLLGVSATAELTELHKKALERLENGEDEDVPSLSDEADSSLRNSKKTDIANILQQAKSTIALDEAYISIDALKVIKAVLKDDHDALNRASRTKLVFSSPPSTTELSPEQVRFQQRMVKLKYKQEEHNYNKLTKNLGMAAPKDDVTTKSMTYAASIGLNMIVAPLSFGCLMYFFAGGLMDYFWPRSTALNPHVPDIRKVIMGVVSGVLMLFVEMILFVIRTHEMDKAMRKKQKKANDSPFGHYNAAMERTYKEE